MNMHRFHILVPAIAFAMAAAAAPLAAADHHEGSDSKVAGLSKAVCVLQPTEGNEAHGTVTFTQVEDGVEIVAHVWGLKPNSKHGFHIHQYGDISAEDGTATGGHFNPEGVDHAGPNAAKRHVGDLGNLESDENGHAMYKRVDKHVQIHGEYSILSRGVIVHAGADDLTSQPTGAAGARIAQGAIGLAKSE